MSEKMIFLTEEQERRLSGEFPEEAVTDEIINLVRIATTAHEHAFHARMAKETFLRLISEAWELEVDAVEPDWAVFLKQKLTNQGVLEGIRTYEELMNIWLAAETTHKLKSINPALVKEVFLRWVEEAWDTGKHQRKVYNMEVEGSVMNSLGVISSFACALFLYGENRELLVPKTRV